MNDDMLSPQSLSIEPLRRDRITAISSAVQRRPIVLVLGMHRSGTSLCSHILSALGVDMADKITGPGNASVTPDNPRGHWERWEIVEFHDRILHLFNRDYLGRFHDFALPMAWWADPRVAQIRREIVTFLEQRMREQYFGFKDPRTVRLMPMWHQIFNELKLAPKVVLCLRNPAQIGRSLSARDGLDPQIGEYRWLIHMIDFYRYTNKYDFCTIEYEAWFSNPSVNIERLQRFLDLSWQQSESDLALLLSDLIDPTARHDDSNHREASQPLVRTLYKLASRDGEDKARDQIAYFVSQFTSFQQLQRPLLQAFEDVVKTAAKYPQIEQEAAALLAAVNERDSVVDAADARAASAEGRLAEALREIDQQRTQIAGLTEERDQRETMLANLSRRVDELVTTLEATRAKVALHEAAVAQAERVAQERTAAAEAMQAEVETLRKTLAQAEQQRTAPAMQAEIAALWDSLEQLREEARQREAAMLAEVEDETKKRAATTTALDAEIATLRGKLVQAEGEASWRAATTAALQAEIATLQGTLAAARQVGNAVIAAFRVEAAAPPKPDGLRGWRQAIIRLLGAEAS